MSDMPGSGAVVGSQSFYELPCEPCNREDKHLKAAAYCVGCEEYFCHTCVKSHKRFVGTKDHVLLEGEKMPKLKPEKRKEKVATPEAECTDKCEKHRGEIVKYYCPDHKVVGCTDCITLGHKSCSKAQLISSVSCQREARQLCDSFKKHLQELSANFDACLNETAAVNKDEAVKQYEATLDSFRKYKSEVVEALNALETAIEKEAKIQKEADIKNIDEMSVSCKNLLTEIAAVEAEFDALRSSNKRSQLFTMVHRSGSKLKEWEKHSRELEMKNRVQGYTFEGSLRDVVQNPESLGKLVREQDLRCTNKSGTKYKASSLGQKQSGRVCSNPGCGSRKVELACGHELCPDCARGQDKQERTCPNGGLMTVLLNSASPRMSNNLNPVQRLPKTNQNDTNVLLAGKTRTYFLLQD